MSLLMRQALVLFKIETVNGVNPVPTAAANAVLGNVTAPRPVVATAVDRNNIQAFLGHQGSVQVNDHSEFEIEVEATASGTPGEAPGLGPLFRACGYSETIVEDESVSYQPVSTGFESATILYNLSGKQHVFVGCRGSWTFDGSPGQIPKFRFKFVGFSSAISDVPLNALGANYGKFTTPLGISKANTSLELFGITLPVYAFTIDSGVTPEYINVINAESVDITNRASTGSVTHENTLVAVKDWEGLARLGTLGALEFQHGKIAGRIIKITAPNVQYSEPTNGDQNGKATLQASLKFKPLVGNDETVLEFS